MNRDSRPSPASQEAKAKKPAETISASAYRALLEEPKRGNRGAHGHYGADGEWYDSDAEAVLVARVRLRERAGKAYNVQRQKRFDLHANGGKYIGFAKVDIAFFDVDEGRDRYQDAKGDRERDTALSMWKFRHIKAEYGVDVEIVRIKKKRRR